MADKGIVVIAPSQYSLIACSVCELLLREGINIEAVVIKKFGVSRFRQEFRRDGTRLLKKIWRKLILKEMAYDPDNADTIIAYRKRQNIVLQDLRELTKDGIRVFQTHDLNGADVQKLLAYTRPEMVLFTGGGLIRSEILSLAGRGMINCHMGILPEYKGMDVVEWPLLLNDMDNLGVTVHYMDTGVDTGDILFKEYIRPVPGETVLQLRQRFEPIMVESLLKAVRLILEGNDKPVRQEKAGRQYFIMHSRLMEIAARNLENLGK